MNKPATITLKIIGAQDVLDSFPKEKPLTENQKELIRFIARTAVEEYIKEQKIARPVNTQDRILRLPEVVALAGLSRATIYHRINEGDFPKSLKLGPRSVGQKESQVTAWLDSRNKDHA